jgi:membrane fusion protein, multidrug efflux system
MTTTGKNAPEAARRPRWPWIFMFLLLAGVTAGWFVARDRTAPAEGAGGPFGGPPGGRRMGGEVNVGSALATRADLPVRIEALGTVTPLESVVVRSRVEGELRSLHFTEGQRVKKGDLLAQIDPRAFEVELAQAKAARARNQALLVNAREDLARYDTLLGQDSIAAQQVSNQRSLVRQYEAAVQADDATIASARLSLHYARITAPISGRIGLRQATPGNLVRASDADGLLTITQSAPISVVFALPEPSLPGVRAAIGGGKGLVVEARDRDNKTVLATGSLRILDNQIDVATGTVKARAIFDNADEALFPNQFVNVSVRLATLAGVVVVPASAIQRGDSGPFVYVVGPDLTVSMRPVKIGELDGERQQVSEGLLAGERVVTDGVDRLREGDKVKVDGASAAARKDARAAGRPESGGPAAAPAH